MKQERPTVHPRWAGDVGIESDLAKLGKAEHGKAECEMQQCGTRLASKLLADSAQVVCHSAWTGWKMTDRSSAVGN